MHTAAWRGALAVITVAVLTTSTGCSSVPSRDSEDSELLKGLSALAEANGNDSVIYLDAAKARKLSKDDPKRYRHIARPGGSLLSRYDAAPWGRHLKATQIDVSVDTAQAGHWEGTFDAEAITAALKENGYRQREVNGTRVWARSGTKETSFEIAQDEISYSSLGPEPMAAVQPREGTSLADHKDYWSAADCLGDVYRADFGPFTPAEPVRLSAVGQQASSAAENTEIMCFVTKNKATADRLGAKLRSTVRAETPDFDGTEVSVDSGDRPVVRAVVPDTAAQRPGRLLLTDVELWLTAVSQS
ncbi:hypothetical protein ACF07S_26845 [Streptomyces sp. NPDC016640]|uniref:hypothetical protein n=1 Tax=Streptomyces sp. NPDC016640 TaxID=3364969 RepID=UPI0036FABAB8